MWCLFQCVCESVSHVFVSYSSSSGLDHESVILYIILVMMHRLMYCLVVDGSLLKKVFVNLTDTVCLLGLSEEKVWTTLKNNLSPQTSVTSAEQEGKAVLQITYNVTDEQVHRQHTHTHTGELRVHFFFVCIALVLIVEDTATIWVKLKCRFKEKLCWFLTNFVSLQCVLCLQMHNG